jgi:hypothetical protein
MYSASLVPSISLKLFSRFGTSQSIGTIVVVQPLSAQPRRDSILPEVSPLPGLIQVLFWGYEAVIW